MSTVPSSTEVDTTSITLRKVASGKVRDIFEIDQNSLLIVATDRCSAFDVVMGNVILATECCQSAIMLMQSGCPVERSSPDTIVPALVRPDQVSNP